MSTKKMPRVNAPREDGADAGGFGGGDSDLNDAFLARALSQAPDRAALPDWRVRQAVLDHAHDAVSAAEELLTASRTRTAWWNLRTWWRAGGKEEGSRGMPWAAALATVVIGVLVTTVWHREPTPDARPEFDPQMPRVASPEKKEQAAKEQATQEQAMEEPAREPADERLPNDVEPERRSSALGASPPAPASPAAPTAPVVPAAPAAPAAPPTASAPPAPPRSEAESERAEARLEKQAPVVEAPLLSPSQMQDLAKSQSRVDLPPMPAQPPQERPATAVAPPPAFAPPILGRSPSADVAAPGGARASGGGADRADAAAMATAKDANAAAAAAATSAGTAPAPMPGVPQQAAPAAAPSSPAANYASLARWSELHIASVSGQVRTVPRVEGSSLVALLNEAAALESSGEVLRELPQWRVALERKGQPLALLEVGRSQLRWTEGAGAPVTSRPSPAMLEALNTALREALRGPAGRPRK